MIISRTPFRISFFGGGTDYPAWYKEHGGSVLATTIDKYSYITARYLPPFFEHRSRIVYSNIETVKNFSEIDHPSVRNVLQWMDFRRGVEIHYDGDLPARSGMGSSSSFTVGLIHALMALTGKYASREDLAQNAIHVEQDLIKENVGSQDQICAAYGGFNRVDFHSNGRFDVSPVLLPQAQLDSFNDQLMLFFTGLSRTASEIAGAQIANLKSREVELKRMQAMVPEAMKLLSDSQFEDFGALMHENWMYKRSLSSLVSTPKIDEIYEVARKSGALGGKLLGAGGGGFLLLLVPKLAQDAVRTALSSFLHVPFRFENSGSKIVLYQPQGL